MRKATEQLSAYHREAADNNKAIEARKSCHLTSGANDGIKDVPDDPAQSIAMLEGAVEFNLDAAAALLRDAREELGLSQAELAKLAGEDAFFIRDLEQDRKRKLNDALKSRLIKILDAIQGESKRQAELRQQKAVPRRSNLLRLAMLARELSTDELIAFTEAQLADARAQFDAAQELVVSLRVKLSALQRAKAAELQLEKNQGVIEALGRIEARKNTIEALNARSRADASQLDLLKRIKEYEARVDAEQDEEKQREIILQFDAELSSL